jgi:uncharacterized protein with von Willebrand factor type A (vWA) domain
MSISPRTPKAGKAPRAEKTARAPKAARSKQVNDIEDEDEAPAAKPVAAKAAASGDDAALSKRLPEMTDFQLRAYQQSTTRISGDVKHAKSAAAKNTLALIEEEMARRIASPGSAPSGVRVGVARPKAGKKRDD